MVTRYNHTRELRTIGQQLDKQSIDIFDLRYEEGDYILECADPNPPFIDIIVCRYSAFELSSLELTAVQARSAGFNFVNFESMAEILRAIGRQLEKLDAKLPRLAIPDSESDGTRYKVEYETRDGRYHTEKIATNEIDELARSMYKERARIKGNPQERSSTT